MENWLVSLIVSAVVTSTIGGFISWKVSQFFKKKDEAQEKIELEHQELEKLKEAKNREERKQDVSEIVSTELKPLKEKIDTIAKGTQASLRHELYELFDFWSSKGYCPREVKSDVENLYNSYHALGKNGVMDRSYEALMALPEKKPVKKSSK